MQVNISVSVAVNVFPPKCKSYDNYTVLELDKS